MKGLFRLGAAPDCLAIFCLATFCLAGAAARAEEPAPALSTYVAEIQGYAAQGKNREAFDLLRDAPTAESANIIAWEKNNADGLFPAFTYDLANRIFAIAPVEALRWYFLGNLRASYDIMRCQDRARAQQSMAALNAMVPTITRFVGLNLKEAAVQARRAMEWDDAHPARYPQDWACRRVQSAMVAPEHWPRLRASLRQELFNSLGQPLGGLESR